MTHTDGRIKTVNAGSGKIWIILLVFALLLYVVGVYLGFIKSAGFVRTTGVVVSVRGVDHYESDLGRNVTTYYPTVAYTVDGEEYTSELDIGNLGDGEGKEVSIQYNPNNPAEVNYYSPGTVILIFVIGTGILALAILILVMGKKPQKKTG